MPGRGRTLAPPLQLSSFKLEPTSNKGEMKVILSWKDFPVEVLPVLGFLTR